MEFSLITMSEELYSMKDLGGLIRKLRRIYGITQQELGDAIGVSRPHISSCESGLYRLTLDNVIRIRNYFNNLGERLTVDAMLEGKRPTVEQKKDVDLSEYQIKYLEHMEKQVSRLQAQNEVLLRQITGNPPQE